MQRKEFLEKWRAVTNEHKNFVQSKLLVLSQNDLNYKATADTWSILECIEHLNKYSAYYVPAISKQGLNSKENFHARVKYTWFGRWSISTMNPNNQKKVKALKRLNPVGSELSMGVLNDFINYQNELLKILERGEQLPLNLAKIPSDIMKLLRLRLGECIEFVLVHQQRHMLQIERIISEL